MTRLIKDEVDWVAASPSNRLIATFDEPGKAGDFAKDRPGIKIFKRTVTHEEVND